MRLRLGSLSETIGHLRPLHLHLERAEAFRAFMTATSRRPQRERLLEYWSTGVLDEPIGDESMTGSCDVGRQRLVS